MTNEAPAPRTYSDPQGSEKKGILGFVEGLLRKFKTVAHILLGLPLFFLGAIAMGLAAAPAILFFQWSTATFGQEAGSLSNAVVLGISLTTGYFVYGISLIFLIPIFNFVLHVKLKPWRGTYYSLEAIRWYIHNAATYVVRFTFLEFATPSPLSILFYKMMGMKIGAGAIINTTAISDPSLIELGPQCTIGGSAVLTGHYGQGGYLVLAKTTIGRRATIGLGAIIMGGVTIGENVKVLGNSVVLPKTVIPDNETWGGIPARKLSGKELVGG